MTNSHKRYAAVTLTFLILLTPVIIKAQTDSEVRAASILFQNFETVAYTKTDFLHHAEAHDRNFVANENALRLPFLELLGSLKANVIAPNTTQDFEKYYPAVLVGSKNFVGPEGLGMVSANRCYIGVLNDETEPNLEPDLHRVAYELIGGRQVWTWSVPPYEGYSRPTIFYAAQIGREYLLVTNNKRDFETTAKALASALDSKPSIIGLPGWETFSTYKYWIHRSVQRSGSISPDASGIKSMGEDVVGLTFFADLDLKESYLQVFSSNSNMKVAPQILSGTEIRGFQASGAGVWKTSISLSKNTVGDDPLLNVFFLMGFGIAL
jgi:hypothetical protein